MDDVAGSPSPSSRRPIDRDALGRLLRVSAISEDAAVETLMRRLREEDGRAWLSRVTKEIDAETAVAVMAAAIVDYRRAEDVARSLRALMRFFWAAAQPGARETAVSYVPSARLRLAWIDIATVIDETTGTILETAVAGISEDGTTSRTRAFWDDFSERGTSAGRPQIPGYGVGELIGRGAMSAVYRAQRQTDGLPVALKLLRTNFLGRAEEQRFRHEARILEHLSHPGIVRVLESGTAVREDATHAFLALELVDGVAISDAARTRNLGAADAATLVAALAEIVHAAHEQGVIHRDLKPNNVLLDAEGRVRVLDFGIARFASADLRDGHPETRVGEMLGTYPYVSPEQASGDPYAVDTRTDIYAIGVMFAEITLGTALGRDAVGPDAPRRTRHFVPPYDLIEAKAGPETAAVIRKATEIDKRDRYRSAAALAADLRALARGEAPTARPVSGAEAIWRALRRNPPLLIGLIATVATLVAGWIATSLALSASRESEERLNEVVSDIVSQSTLVVDMFVQLEREGVSLDMRRDLLKTLTDPLEEKVRQVRSTPEIRRAQARWRLVRSDILFEEGRFAESYTLRSLVLQMLEADTENRLHVSATIDRCLARVKLGDAAAMLGRPAETDRLYNQVLEDATALARRHPDDRASVDEVNWALERCCGRARQSNRRLEAADLAMRRVRWTREEYRRWPDDVSSARGLATATVVLCEIAFDAGYPLDDLIKELGNAREIVRRAMREHPKDPFVRNTFCVASQSLARFFESAGRFAEAAAAARDSLEGAESDVTGTPGAQGPWEILAVALIRVARLEAAAGARADALMHAERAVSAARRSYEIDPRKGLSVRIFLTIETLEIAGDRKTVLAEMRRVLDEHRSKDPNDPQLPIVTARLLLENPDAPTHEIEAVVDALRPLTGEKSDRSLAANDTLTRALRRLGRNEEAHAVDRVQEEKERALNAQIRERIIF